MKHFISNYKKWLGYLLFALILTVALLYYRFPSGAVLDYLQATANRADPRKTEVSMKDMPDGVIVRIDSLLLRPGLLSLLRGKPEYCFHCVAYKGDLIGCVYIEKDRTRGFIDTEIELRNILIGDCAYLSHLIGRHIEGTLGGTVSYTGRHNLLMDGSGEANLRLSHGRVELLQPFLTFESIDFNEMEIEMVLKKQQINLTRLELKGQQLHGTLSGVVTLKEKFAKSSLDLRGTIEPYAESFKGKGGAHDTLKLLKHLIKNGTVSFEIHGTPWESPESISHNRTHRKCYKLLNS
ncbi:MAG: type II secretion system protein GspN [Deltaproteobacteria bacterium]|nr:type II secretion system protein GspN [Deltaproteobacteria bacterium]